MTGLYSCAWDGGKYLRAGALLDALLISYHVATIFGLEQWFAAVGIGASLCTTPSIGTAADGDIINSVQSREYFVVYAVLFCYCWFVGGVLFFSRGCHCCPWIVFA